MSSLINDSLLEDDLLSAVSKVWIDTDLILCYKVINNLIHIDTALQQGINTV